MNTPLTGLMDMHRALAAATGLSLILGLAACGGGGGGGDGPGSKELHLIVGNSLPLHGSSKVLGLSGEQASEVALDQIKQAIESDGADHNVRIVNEDQGADPAAAVDSARQLVNTDRASCLIGPWSSPAVTQVANDVTVPAKVLEISPVAAGDDVTELDDHDLIDSTALPVSTEGEALAKAIERGLGGIEGHTVNVAASTDPNAETVSQDFIQEWQGSNGTVGGPVVLAPPALSMAPQITSGSPDAVLLVDGPIGFAQLAPALASSSGWDASTAWGSDELVSPGLPGEVGRSAIEGMRAVAPGAPQGAPQGADTTSAFVEAFESASPHKVKVAPYAAQQFDATILCYLAAVAAGSTDGQKMADELIDITAPGGTEYSWQQLPNAIKALEDGKDIDFTGASGPIDMDVHGNATDGVWDVYQYAPGGLKVVGEVPVSKPNPAIP